MVVLWDFVCSIDDSLENRRILLTNINLKYDAWNLMLYHAGFML